MGQKATVRDCSAFSIDEWLSMGAFPPVPIEILCELFDRCFGIFGHGGELASCAAIGQSFFPQPS